MEKLPLWLYHKIDPKKRKKKTLGVIIYIGWASPLMKGSVLLITGGN
jgi:hypothetical protein